jgi:peroxiredoxin
VLPALPFPIYRAESSGTELAKKLPFVPATVILDDKGIVTQAWFGVPTREQEDELLRVLGPAAS